MKLYMKVSRDKYELPEAVAETKTELARMLGIDPRRIHRAMYNIRSGITKHSSYIEIEVDDD